MQLSNRSHSYGVLPATPVRTSWWMVESNKTQTEPGVDIPHFGNMYDQCRTPHIPGGALLRGRRHKAGDAHHLGNRRKALWKFGFLGTPRHVFDASPWRIRHELRYVSSWLELLGCCTINHEGVCFLGYPRVRASNRSNKGNQPCQGPPNIEINLQQLWKSAWIQTASTRRLKASKSSQSWGAKPYMARKKVSK